MKKIIIAGVVFVFIFAVVGVIAQAQIPLEAKIKSVKGDVEIKGGPGSSWQKATPGKVLREGAMISAGYGAEAQLLLADNSVVIVYQLTQMKIDKFFRDKAKVKTDLNLKIGKVRAQVQRVGDAISDFNIVTPTSVVSVRGTGTDVQESDRGTHVQTLVHTVQVSDRALGRKVIVREGQETTVAKGEVPTQTVVEAQKKAKVDTAVVGLTKVEVKIRQTVDIPEVKPGEPGKVGSVS